MKAQIKMISALLQTICRKFRRCFGLIDWVFAFSLLNCSLVCCRLIFRCVLSRSQYFCYCLPFYGAVRHRGERTQLPVSSCEMCFVALGYTKSTTKFNSIGRWFLRHTQHIERDFIIIIVKPKHCYISSIKNTPYIWSEIIALIPKIIWMSFIKFFLFIFGYNFAFFC